eukprot:TRINITY_DN2944_c0_g1_i1.p1 TRINITY_DN2944_c0_g1~~TRINITY_DN2944_c0_g1_i1.p1  ORF type:complete len:147 (+),score=46.36 TRINITY_DN2944_c0_g1_i1:69-443(+)
MCSRQLTKEEIDFRKKLPNYLSYLDAETDQELVKEAFTNTESQIIAIHENLARQEKALGLPTPHLDLRLADRDISQRYHFILETHKELFDRADVIRETLRPKSILFRIKFLLMPGVGVVKQKAD